MHVLRHFREGAFGPGRRLACSDMEACACGCQGAARAPNAFSRAVAPVTRIVLRSRWGDPWVDPPGILGGSEVNSGHPATMTLVKIGGSVETIASSYHIRKGDT